MRIFLSRQKVIDFLSPLQYHCVGGGAVVEIWKDIPGYEGIYQASSHGRIRGVEGRTTNSTRHGTRRWKERVLKPKSCANYAACGYRVSLWKDKRSKDYLVARLVATTFLGNNLQTKLTVNHKDGNRLNNNISNLEWLTMSQNVKYGFENNQYPTLQTTLTRMDGTGSETYRSASEAGREIGRTSGYIHCCKKRGYNARGKDGVEYIISVRKTGGSLNKPAK